MLITVKGLKVFQGGAILEKVPLTGRVLGLYCNFFRPTFFQLDLWPNGKVCKP